MSVATYLVEKTNIYPYMYSNSKLDQRYILIIYHSVLIINNHMSTRNVQYCSTANRVMTEKDIQNEALKRTSSGKANKRSETKCVLFMTKLLQCPS